MIKITVITVSFDAAETIGDALRSVAGQSWPYVEHIVIDGASRDQTLKVIEANAARVARVVSEPDKGIYDAMNKGMQLATGDVIGFLNADDVYASPDALRDIATALQEHPDCDAAYGDLVYVDRLRPEKVFRVWKSDPFDPSSLRNGWMPPHPTLYVRRSVLQAVGGFDIGLGIAADYELMVRLFKRPSRSYIYVPRTLVSMRTGGASNRSLNALLRKSREDLTVMRRHGLGGVVTLLAKNLRKIGQIRLR